MKIFKWFVALWVTRPRGAGRSGSSVCSQPVPWSKMRQGEAGESRTKR